MELCGPGACLQHKTCPSWDRNTPGDWLGVVRTAWTEPGALVDFRCSPSGTNCRGTPPSQVGTACAAKANLYRTNLLNTTLAGLPSSVTSPLTVTSTYVQIDKGRDTESMWTVWQCFYNVSGYPIKDQGAKPICGCDVYEPQECERSRGITTTEPGQVRPTSPGAPTVEGDRREFTAAPQCLTCDELPFDDESSARAKAQCLSQQLAGASGDLRSSLAARLQLLYQLAGERFLPEQVTQVRELYEHEQAAGPACRSVVEIPQSCQPAANAQGLPARAQLCRDLIDNPHTSRGTAQLELERCLGQAAAFASIGAECRSAVRDTSDVLAQGVLHKAHPSFADDLPAALATARAQLVSWWQKAELLAAGDQEWLYLRSSEHLRWLWSEIEAQRMPLPDHGPSSDAEAAALLADLAGERLAADAAVLAAMFAPGQLGTPPLLALTSDALQALFDRLDRLMPLHDVACRLSGCKTSPLRSSAVSELVHVLASLPEQQLLSTALASAAHLQQQQPELYSALVQVRDQHAYLTAAWGALGHPRPFSELAELADTPSQAAALAAIVRSAKAAWTSYQGSGSFSPWRVPRLTVSTLRKPELLEYLDGQIAAVDSDRSEYLLARRATLDDVLGQIAQGNALQLASARWDEVSARQLELAERIDAIAQREAQETIVRADFQRGFEQLMNSGAVDAAAAYQIQAVLPGLTARGTDARYEIDTPTDLRRDRFAVTPLHAGETLRARITGNWAPDCALRKARLIGPRQRQAKPITVSSGVTGPEGYWMTWQQTAFRSHSTTSSNGRSHQVALTAQSCGGGMVNGNGTNLCLSYTYSRYWNSNTTDGDGKEERRGISFNSGLRLPQTPFPDAPAGSLLAVLTRAGAPEEPLEVVVLGREAILTAPAPEGSNAGDYEVHLVVNDASALPEDEACHQDSSALNIELVRSSPLGNVAQALGSAMAKTLTAIDGRAAPLLRQGEVTAAEANLLRTEAWVRLREELPAGVGLAGMPAELRQYFEAGLERELASLARRAEQRSLERSIMRLGMELDAIASEQTNLEAQSRLRYLIPRWRLRDLAGRELADTVGRLADVLVSHAVSVFELHDPAGLQILKIAQQAKLDELIDVNLTTSLEDAVADYLQLATATRAALAAASLEPPSTQRRTVVIAIPRPPGPGAEPWSGPYRSVSPATARAFWSSAFEAPGVLSARVPLALSPPDLYTGPGGLSHLSCQDQAPVVRHLGLYLATDGWLERLIDMEVAGIAATGTAVSFPVPGKVYTFGAADPAGVPIAPRVLNGDTVEVLSAQNFGSWPFDLDAGAGISPFTSFQLNLQGFQDGQARSVFDRARALFVVMEVERKISVSPAFVPGICVLTAPATP